jgi:hypothetical protein
MHRCRRALLATTALAVAASGCARSKPTVSPKPYSGTFSFIAQTGADSALEGRFEGTASVENNWVTVEIPRTILTIPPGSPENWRNLTVRAFLATDYQPGSWKAAVQSRPVNVFRFIDFSRTENTVRRTLPLETPLRFLVPVPPGASLATSRLAFELEWTFVMGSYGDTDSRIAFSGPLPVPAGPSSNIRPP